jgi:hypothetical protein
VVGSVTAHKSVQVLAASNKRRVEMHDTSCLSHIRYLIFHYDNSASMRQKNRPRGCLKNEILGKRDVRNYRFSDYGNIWREHVESVM